MSECRARCNECHANFCAECKIAPYHVGYTCASFVHYVDKRRCRFCLEKSEGYSTFEFPALSDVCHKEACKELGNNVCHRMQEECNHPCYGCRGEEHCLPCLHEECSKKNEGETFGVTKD